MHRGEFITSDSEYDEIFCLRNRKLHPIDYEMCTLTITIRIHFESTFSDFIFEFDFLANYNMYVQ